MQMQIQERTTGLAPNTMNGVLGIAISLWLSVGLSWAYEL